MTYARYFVVRHQEAWMIKFNDEEYGPFPDHAEALMFATDAAERLSEVGETAQVIWTGEMGANGHFHHEWTYGRDRHQPANRSTWAA